MAASESITPDEEFCGKYKGDHYFEPGANTCNCGRAYVRAPRPVVKMTDIPLHSLDCGSLEGYRCTCRASGVVF